MATKVFVGNLAFHTTDQDLQAYFEGSGEIKSAVIITRGRRSLGYGFVDFTTPEQAEEAVKKFDQSAFFDRTIKVEIAIAPSERQQEPKEPREPRQRKGKANQNEQPQLQDTQPEAPQPAEGGPAQRRRKPRRNVRKKKNNTETDTGDANTETTGTGNTPTKPKKERQQREKVMSQTTLFVANLPFSINDEGLSQIFQENGVVNAHVVRTRNGRSRGYGFVEFANSEQQLAALEAKNGYKILGQNNVEREISISISSSVPPAANEEPIGEGQQ